jgi:hypothetical protein
LEWSSQDKDISSYGNKNQESLGHVKVKSGKVQNMARSSPSYGKNKL